MVGDPYDFFYQFNEMQKEMERFFHYLSHKRQQVIFSPDVWQPHIDVYETTTEVVVVAELAGIEINSLNVTLEGTTLRIRGIRVEFPRGKKQTYYQIEINYGQFERTIGLPTSVDAQNTEATYKNGFLEIILPKLRTESGKLKDSLKITVEK